MAAGSPSSSQLPRETFCTIGAPLEHYARGGGGEVQIARLGGSVEFGIGVKQSGVSKCICVSRERAWCLLQLQVRETMGPLVKVSEDHEGGGQLEICVSAGLSLSLA